MNGEQERLMRAHLLGMCISIDTLIVTQNTFASGCGRPSIKGAKAKEAETRLFADKSEFEELCRLAAAL